MGVNSTGGDGGTRKNEKKQTRNKKGIIGKIEFWGFGGIGI